MKLPGESRLHSYVFPRVCFMGHSGDMLPSDGCLGHGEKVNDGVRGNVDDDLEELDDEEELHEVLGECDLGDREGGVIGVADLGTGDFDIGDV